MVSAHPGGTANDGCHYCGINCDKWGVSWNRRHCHGKLKQGKFISISQNEIFNEDDCDPNSGKLRDLGFEFQLVSDP